jgi:hypothetical protein
LKSSTSGLTAISWSKGTNRRLITADLLAQWLRLYSGHVKQKAPRPPPPRALHQASHLLNRDHAPIYLLSTPVSTNKLNSPPLHGTEHSATARLSQHCWSDFNVIYFRTDISLGHVCNLHSLYCDVINVGRQRVDLATAGNADSALRKFPQGEGLGGWVNRRSSLQNILHEEDSPTFQNPTQYTTATPFKMAVFVQTELLHVKVKVRITTGGQSVSPSWCQTPIWDPRPIFLSPWNFL